MMVHDIIHRLRVRANNAQTAGEVHLAQDLRLAIDALTRLDREQQLTRPAIAAQRPKAVEAAK